MDKKEPTSLMFAFDELSRNGASSRIFMALQSKPKEGLSVEEILEMTGLSRGTLKCYGIPKLLHAQVVVKQKTENGKIFRIAPGLRRTPNLRQFKEE